MFDVCFDVGFVGFGLASFLHWLVACCLVGFLFLVFGLVVGFARCTWMLFVVCLFVVIVFVGCVIVFACVVVFGHCVVVFGGCFAGGFVVLGLGLVVSW